MADFNFYDNLAVDDNDGEETGVLNVPGRDSVIVGVDCCQEMFQNSLDTEDDTPFARVCEAVKDLLRNRIICNDIELHGLVLFGTEKHSNPSDFKNIYIVQDLDTPSAARIEELQNLEESTEEIIKKEYGLNHPCLISELLWCCTSMFSRCTLKMSSKTLIILTWNDNPHKDDRNLQNRAKTKAKDLIVQDTVIQVLSFNPSFEYATFYRSIVSDIDIDTRLVENPIDGIKDLYDLLLRKCSKQRSLAGVTFKLADDVEFAVRVYTPVRRATKTASVSIDPKTNQGVIMKSNFVEKDTAEILMMSDIKYAQTWGGKSISFEHEELQEMKRFSGSGLRLLGFKPRHKALKMHQHTRLSQFLYPNEQLVAGSTKLFSAMLTKCKKRDVIPICSFSYRDNIPPRVVALLPQEEQLDCDTGEQLQPPGFYVIYTPFSEDIRNIDVPETSEPDVDNVEAAESFIKKLKFTFRPSNFENPALQTHYRNLEAMALEKDEPDTVEDFTLPNMDRMHKKAGDLIEQFKGRVFPADYDPTAKLKATGAKRKAAGGTEKKQISTSEVEEMVKAGRLAKLTVPVLKEICKSRGLNPVGKKNDLMQAIVASFGS